MVDEERKQNLITIGKGNYKYQNRLVKKAVEKIAKKKANQDCNTMYKDPNERQFCNIGVNKEYKKDIAKK